ncbi:hypothetical protein D3C84_556180 [compost metagenome]
MWVRCDALCQIDRAVVTKAWAILTGFRIQCHQRGVVAGGVDALRAKPIGVRHFVVRHPPTRFARLRYTVGNVATPQFFAGFRIECMDTVIAITRVQGTAHHDGGAFDRVEIAVHRRHVGFPDFDQLRDVGCVYVGKRAEAGPALVIAVGLPVGTFVVGHWLRQFRWRLRLQAASQHRKVRCVRSESVTDAPQGDCSYQAAGKRWPAAWKLPGVRPRRESGEMR